MTVTVSTTPASATTPAAPAASAAQSAATVSGSPTATAAGATKKTAATSRSTTSAARSATKTAPAASTKTPPPSPQSFVTAADVQNATKAVKRMTLAEEAGSVIMASSADAVGSSEVANLHLGGVILMGENGTVDGTTDGSPSQVLDVTTRLQQQAGTVPILVGTDQEYGDVTRLVTGFTEFPGSSQVAAIPDTAQAVALQRKISAAAGEELLAVGVNVDFAPDADVLPIEGSSGIGDRSYGSDPQRVADLVSASVRGYQSVGVAATLKHFPGLGRVPQDTHTTLPTLDVDCSSWNTHESVPMAAGIKAGVALVMTGHVELPSAGAGDGPTSLSPVAVTELLRGTGHDGCRGLGFTGVSITDSLQMAPVTDKYGSGSAAVAALKAGEDLLLMPVSPSAAVQGITQAVQAGDLSRSTLEQAAIHDYALRLALARTPRPALDVIDSAAHRELAAQAKVAAG